jgi:hypothetical protein
MAKMKASHLFGFLREISRGQDVGRRSSTDNLEGKEIPAKLIKHPSIVQLLEISAKEHRQDGLLKINSM